MYHRVIIVCACSHLKRVHVNRKDHPNGPCFSCGCRAFTPEAQCVSPKCGHGQKAHRSGRCHECGCRTFRTTKETGH